MSKISINIFWFRRDLRLSDNAGLYHALRSGIPVLPVFIFDTNILNVLPNKTDRRVRFIHDCLLNLQRQLIAMGSSLNVLYNTPLGAFAQLTEEFDIRAVYTNHDYEPYATKRDDAMRDYLAAKSVSFFTYKDQVIFEKDEILKDDGTPYTVFTPYSKRWKAKLNSFYARFYPTEKYFSSFLKSEAQMIPSLREIGFEAGEPCHIPAALDKNIAASYDKTRDYPAIEGATLLSVHLRFGTISIRKLVREVSDLNTVLLNELIWREFYQSILWHFPHVVNQAFKKEYDALEWRNDPDSFELWKRGETGYPIVDAGMRQLNATGYMHNRVRMITASFLSKHLLIDWRWGEAYFAEKLLDYDLAANNGGWQWSAGCGCDAAPYFRIFNPYLQTAKFDPELKYIKQWVPEYAELTYPRPIIDHNFARERCLKVYASALKG